MIAPSHLPPSPKRQRDLWGGINGSISSTLVKHGFNRPVAMAELYVFSAAFLTFCYMFARYMASDGRESHDPAVFAPLYSTICDELADEGRLWWQKLLWGKAAQKVQDYVRRDARQMLDERMAAYHPAFAAGLTELNKPNGLFCYDLIVQFTEKLFEKPLAASEVPQVVVPLSIELLQIFQMSTELFQDR